MQSPLFWHRKMYNRNILIKNDVKKKGRKEIHEEKHNQNNSSTYPLYC